MVNSAILDRHRAQVDVAETLDTFISIHHPELLASPGIIYIPALGDDTVAYVRQRIRKHQNRSTPAHIVVPIGIGNPPSSSVMVFDVPASGACPTLDTLPDAMPLADAVATAGLPVWEVPSNRTTIVG